MAMLSTRDCTETVRSREGEQLLVMIGETLATFENWLVRDLVAGTGVVELL